MKNVSKEYAIEGISKLQCNSMTKLQNEWLISVFLIYFLSFLSSFILILSHPFFPLLPMNEWLTIRIWVNYVDKHSYHWVDLCRCRSLKCCCCRDINHHDINIFSVVTTGRIGCCSKDQKCHGSKLLLFRFSNVMPSGCIYRKVSLNKISLS